MKGISMREKLQSFFIIDKNKVMSSSVVWNTLAGLLSAGQSALILIFISRNLTILDAGMFVIAFAIAVLASTIARYGMRNYQVTDTTAHIHFREYLVMRLIIISGTIVVIVVFLTILVTFGHYSPYMAFVIGGLTLYRMIDAFEDVHLGVYQQQGRLDVGSKIMTIRLLLSTLSICLSLHLGLGLLQSVGIGIIVSIVTAVVLLLLTYPLFRIATTKVNREKIKQLLIDGFPLCIGLSLAVYVGNVPKYMIDAFGNVELQAHFGFLMMPVFVVLILSNFIFQPIIKQLGDGWNQGEYSVFATKVWRQCYVICGLTIVVTLLGIFLGLPILSLLYQVDLHMHKLEFGMLLVGGGIYALATFMAIPITIIRKQSIIARGHVVVTILSLILGGYLVKSFNLLGAALLYLVLNSILVSVFTFTLFRGISKKKVLE